MLSRILQKSISDLFSKKKYNEIVIKIEEYSSQKERPASLSSILGVCRMLNIHKSSSDLLSALSDFEDAFNKSKDNNLSVEALCNFISVCTGDFKKYIEIKKHFLNARKMFLKIEKTIGYNEKLFVHGVDLFNYFCDHKKLKFLLSSLIKNNCKSKTILSSYGFFNNYSYDWNQEDYYNFSLNFKEYFPKYETKNISKIDFKKNKKIKICFVSSDFLNHSLSYFTKALINNLDKNKFETYGIYLGSTNDSDESYKAIVEAFDNWLNLSNQDNQRIINTIQDEKIEILVDQMGLTQANKIEIFNSRVSPLQISWNAFCNTVGFDNIDFLIADKNLIYQGEEKFYAEKILKLKNIWNSHSGLNFKRKLLNLPFNKNNYITFGSFNNFLKISENVVKVWSAILKSIKNSKLILKSSFNYDSEIILKKFEKYNVSGSVEILDRKDYSNLEDHIRLYENIDISLDTFPYNGVTTTFEALWSGVPVICMKGFNFNSRCGESILINSNLKTFISSSEDDYIKKAIYFSENIKILEKERENIFNNILKTNLFNNKGFSKDFEEGIMSIYNRNI